MYSTAAVVAPSFSLAKEAILLPWKGSMKQERNMFSYTVPSSATVTASAVAEAVIMGIWSAWLSTTTATVGAVVTSPMMAVTP